MIDVEFLRTFVMIYRSRSLTAAGRVLHLSQPAVSNHLKALEAKYPALDRISVSLSVGVPKSEALEQLQRFAEQVMPAFRKAEARQPEMVK